MDVISLHQAGFPNAVATLGTAITPEQARIIANYAKEVVITYDSDGAGQAATQRALNHFADVGLPARILKMEGAKDPDEYIKKFGADRFRMLIEHAGDALNFRARQLQGGARSRHRDRQDGVLRRSVRVLAGHRKIRSSARSITRIARGKDVRKDAIQIRWMPSAVKQKRLRTEFRAIEAKSLQRDELNPRHSSIPKESKAEEQIIAYLLHFPEECEMVWELDPAGAFVTDFHRRVYEAICESGRSRQEFPFPCSQTSSVEEMSRITGISARNRGHRPQPRYLEELRGAAAEGAEPESPVPS